MSILPTSIASSKTVGTVEKLFATLSTLLQSKGILAGGYDAAKTAVAPNLPVVISSATQAANLFGLGSQIHRMAIYWFKATGGATPCIAFPLDAADGGVKATKTITLATDSTSSGSYVLRAGSYLLEDLVSVAVASGTTPDDQATAIAAAINAKENLPFTAASALGVVTLTAKTVDISGESLSVTINHKQEETEEAPEGTTFAIADDVTGAGRSDLTDLFAYMRSEGSGWNTSLVQPYNDSTSLNGASTTGGNPNQKSGLYDPLDYRPFNSYTVDTDGGAAALAAAIVLGNARKEYDATGCRSAAPSYPELGYEIASYISGYISVQSVIKPASGYTRIQMPVLFGPLVPSDDWTSYSADPEVKPYFNRDSALQAGITSVLFKGGIATLGDVTSFWHPEDNQNAPFKYVCNQRKIWNYQLAAETYLNGEGLKDRPIVDNVAATLQSQNAIDTDVVVAGLAEIAGFAESYAWIFQAAFTIKNTSVSKSILNPDRFDIVIPIIISGNFRQAEGTIEVDRNLQAVDITVRG